MKYHPRSLEKELPEQSRLLRVWKAWHREQLDEALAGADGVVVAQIMSLLHRLELNPDSAATLIASVQRVDWSAVSYEVRTTLLHQTPH